jgi:hypothetical protein
MADNIRSLETTAFGCSPRPKEIGGGRWDVKSGTIFVQSSVFSELPNSAQLDAKPYGTWVMVSNAHLGEAEQKFTEGGWLLSAGAAIEASAFGCDSKVVERAVNRALQKATDDERGVLEITGVTLDQDSCLDYVSIFARARTIRTEPAPNPVGYEMNSTAPEIAGEKPLAV